MWPTSSRANTLRLATRVVGHKADGNIDRDVDGAGGELPYHRLSTASAPAKLPVVHRAAPVDDRRRYPTAAALPTEA